MTVYNIDGTIVGSQTPLVAGDVLSITATGGLITALSPALDITSGATQIGVNVFGTITATGGGTAVLLHLGPVPAVPPGGTAQFNVGILVGGGGSIRSNGVAIGLAAAADTSGLLIGSLNGGVIEATGTGANAGAAIDLSLGTKGYGTGLDPFGGVTPAPGTLGVVALTAGGIVRAADADAIRLGNGGTVINYGQIIGNNAGGVPSAAAIDFVATDGVLFASMEPSQPTAPNAMISGAWQGVHAGTVADASLRVTVSNSFGSTIEGRNGAGVGSLGRVVIANLDTIIGRVDGVSANGDGDGVQARFGGTILNAGRIEGSGAAGVDGLGHANAAQGIDWGGGTLGNAATGVIKGATDGVLADDLAGGAAPNASVVNNLGTIWGVAGYGLHFIGSQGATVTNAGSIIGGNGTAIQFGDGDDTLTLTATGSLTGRVDGGGGVDTVNLGFVATNITANQDGSFAVTDGGSNSVVVADVETLHFSDGSGRVRSGGQYVTIAATARDFGNDHYADILWRNSGGGLWTWQQQGTQILQAQDIGDPGASWTLKGVADLDNDARVDLVWQNTSGDVWRWQMNGGTVLASNSLGNPGPAWHLRGLADLNGDGRSDLIWQHDDGTIFSWHMNGGTVTGGVDLGVLDASWSFAGSGDLDGNGTADPLWRRSDGTVWTWLMNNGHIQQAAQLGTPDNSWQVVGAGDATGDGKADIFFRNADGRLWEWQMDGAAIAAAGGLGNPGTDKQVVQVADLTGDGRVDLVLQASDGALELWRLNGLAATPYGPIGNPGAGWFVA